MQLKIAEIRQNMWQKNNIISFFSKISNLCLRFQLTLMQEPYTAAVKYWWRLIVEASFPSRDIILLCWKDPYRFNNYVDRAYHNDWNIA